MSTSRRRVPATGPLSPQVVAAFGQFLADHIEAAAAGSPLLTDAGFRYLRKLLAPATNPKASGSRRTPIPRLVHRGLPHWDADARQLWLGGVLLKEFRQPAQNQTALLDAIEARGWVIGHVSNPLPRERDESETEAQERLHETIKNLNRGMPPRTIRFRGDGSGRGVWWEFSGGDFLV
jgi:hypothetical protein